VRAVRLRCNTLQHTTIYCNTLQHAATHCNKLRIGSGFASVVRAVWLRCNTLQHTTTSVLQCNAARSITGSNVLPCVALFCSVLQCVASFVCVCVRVGVWIFSHTGIIQWDVGNRVNFEYFLYSNSGQTQAELPQLEGLHWIRRKRQLLSVSPRSDVLSLYLNFERVLCHMMAMVGRHKPIKETCLNRRKPNKALRLNRLRWRWWADIRP